MTCGKAPIASRMTSPPGVQHAEGGAGEGLAAGRRDELQRHAGRAVMQRRVGDLAGFDRDIGARWIALNRHRSRTT